MTGRVGFCCIYLDPATGKTPALYQFRSATVTHVAKLPRRDRLPYLERAIIANMRALNEVVALLAKAPPAQRMFRITSGLLPLYTHAVAKPVYDTPAISSMIERSLGIIGAKAREAGVRLSFHPGQFCVLNSRREEVRVASIEEFEYHALCAVLMGYRGGNPRVASTVRDDFCINVHGGAWHGSTADSLASWDWSLKRLSRAAQGLITLENDEFAWSSNNILRLCHAQGIRMVLDVHHQWINSGVWVEPNMRHAAAVRRTWAGATPKMHLSWPRPVGILSSAADAPVRGSVHAEFPEWHAGLTKPAARVHADYLWHPACKPYADAWRMAGWDVQVESRSKNLAAAAIA